jgi:predicted dehydrogenase
MIRLAIVGTGGMAHAHANQFKNMRDVKLVACCDIREDAAAAFAEAHAIPHSYGTVSDLLANEQLDAVSNVTIDAAHYPTCMEVIKHGGIHIMCEKPLATSAQDARAMARAAQKAGLITLVNFSYRDAPAIHKAHQLVQDGVIGEVRHVEASYLQSWLAMRSEHDWRNMEPHKLWRLSKKHGSNGVLGDLGVHIVDFATYPVGPVKRVECLLKTFDKIPGNRIGAYRFDANDSALMTVEFANGAAGLIHTSRWGTGHSNSLRLRIHGTKGALVVDLDVDRNSLQICRGKDIKAVAWKTLKCPQTPNMYTRFIRSIKSGVQDQPDFARGAEIQRVLDACFESDESGCFVRV